MRGMNDAIIRNEINILYTVHINIGVWIVEEEKYLKYNEL